jgi:Flp pilus assembly protein protease CpaA
LPTLTDTSLATPLLERPRGLAVAAGLLLAAPVLVSGWVASMPLPILGWAAAFLFLAVERDVHCQRIPNLVTVSAFAAALVYATATGGTGGALQALLGAGTAFGLLLAPYAAGALGAGDVKAAMALGAGFGAAGAAEIVLLAVGFGGLVAIGRLALHGELGALAARWAHCVAASFVACRVVYVPPPPASAAARGIPFAVAIALAVVVKLLIEAVR